MTFFRMFSVFLMAFMFSNVALAYNDLEDMKGKVIVSAGKYMPIMCPIGGKYDCSVWPMGFVKSQNYTDNLCFSITSLTANCSISCEGVVAVGKDNIPYFFKFSSFDISKSPIRIMDCPSAF